MRLRFIVFESSSMDIPMGRPYSWAPPRPVLKCLPEPGEAARGRPPGPGLGGAQLEGLHIGRATSNGDVDSDVCDPPHVGGLPAATYPAVYLGRGQNPLDTRRWRGALSNVQLYMSELPPDAVGALAVGDVSGCPAAPPPPGGARARCGVSHDTFPFARVAAPAFAKRWLVTAASFDADGLLWDVTGTVPIAAGAYFDPRQDWMDMRGGGAMALQPLPQLPATSDGVTIAAWVRWDKGSAVVVSWGGGADPVLILGITASGVAYATHSPTAASPSATLTVVSDRNLRMQSWAHLMVAWGSSAVTIYTNGRPSDTPGASPGAPPAVPRASFSVGPMQGGIADIQV